MNFHKIKRLNYINIFYKIIVIYFLLSFFSYTNAEDKIGSVTDIQGSAISINSKGEERELNIFDPIFLNDEIFVSEQSTLTVQYSDNTTIILKELTSLNVFEFEKSLVRQKFKAEVKKGDIVIESGSIAKSSNGEMLVDLSNMQLGVRGTRLNINIDADGSSKVALAEDSFGNVGEISLSSEGQTTNLNNPEEVLELNQGNELSRREQTSEEKEELKSVDQTLVSVSKIDENDLDQKLEEKLQQGKLEDANNDGIVNASDIEVIKENIKTEKKANLDFIVENSESDNADFLSNVLDQSDEKNIGETMTKIIEVKDDLIENVVDNLSDKENTFITSSVSDEVVAVKEKIFETIVAQETDKSAEILSKVMAKSDEATIASVITNITEKNTNEDSILSLKVMADFSEKSPEKLETFAETNADQIEILSIDAVQKASVSNEDVDLIAKVVAVVNDDIANIVVEEVSKSSSEEKQSLSAKVFQAIVETEPDKIEIIDDGVRDIMIQQTIESAKNQEEGTYTEEENLADIVASIIVSTNTEIATQFIEEVNDIETETNLSLKVISGISEKDSERIDTLSEFNKEQMDQLTIDAVQNAENTSEDSDLIAQVVSVVNDDLVNVMIEEVSKTSTDEKQTLSAKVLQAIVETEPDKMEIINDDIVEIMIEQTIESAKDQAEGTGIQEDENFTDIITDIIVNTNTETASQVIEEINDIETDTNLSLEVISGISEKDSEKLDTLSENNKEQIEQLAEDAIQNAENTTEDSQLIANVVSVVNDDLVNVVVEEVSKTSIDEKQSLSAKVLQAIVETEPDKMEIIDEDIKDTMIEQTIEASIDQQEEGDLSEGEVDLTDIIADIIVNTDTETAEKIIDEVNDSDTDTNLSLKVISGISEKDSEVLNELSENNKEQMEELTEDAIQNAENTSEDSQLIANVVAVANDELANKVVEEVNEAAEDDADKGTLSAKVLKAIVDKEPEKMDIISEENKDDLIENAVEAAKEQQEGGVFEEEETNYSDLIADVIVNTDSGTASDVLEEINNTDTESDLSLQILNDLQEKENFNEVINEISETSEGNEDIVSNIIEDAIEDAIENKDSEAIADIIEESEGDLTDQIIENVVEEAKENDESNNILTDAIEEVMEENPNQVIDIIENNGEINEIIDNLDDPITDPKNPKYDPMYDKNVSPN